MRKFFWALIITTATVALATPVQEPAPVPTQTIQIPSCKPTYAEFVTWLTKYDLQHKKDLIDGQYWGLTYPDIKLILISDEAKGEDAKYVVLHEMTHVCFREKGIRLPHDVEEFFVDLQARQLYNEMFGEKK